MPAPKNSSALSSAARRLLTTLARQPFLDTAAPAADTLIAADLAVRDPAGRLTVTDAGRAHLARLTPAPSATPIDPFLVQHLSLARGEIDGANGRTTVTVDTAESPLLWLARRKGRDGQPLIAPMQLMAGERLRRDFTCAQLMPRTTANWGAAVAQGRRSHSDGGGAISDVIVAARQGVRRALDDVGPELAGLLLDVCCFLKRLDDVERERGWPARSAKVVLQLGLDRLARHYGYGVEARGPAHAAVRAWTAEQTEAT